MDLSSIIINVMIANFAAITAVIALIHLCFYILFESSKKEK